MGANARKEVLLLLSVTMSACAHQIQPEVLELYDGPLPSVAKERCLKRRGNSSLVPEKEFRTDGCSLWPDGDWQSCCVDHDMEYWCGGSASERKKFDHTLGSCIAGKGHSVLGPTMGVAVRVGGLWVLPTPWRWGYGWPWLSSMERDESISDSTPAAIIDD